MRPYLIVALAVVAYLLGRCQQWWVDRCHYTGMAAAQQDDLERKLRLARFLGRMEAIQAPWPAVQPGQQPDRVPATTTTPHGGEPIWS